LEKFSGEKRAKARSAYIEKKEEALEAIPSGAFHMDFSETGLSDSIIEALHEAKIENAGALVLTARMNPDKILDVPGIGPKTLEKIDEFAEKLSDLVPAEPEPEPEPELEKETEQPVDETEEITAGTEAEAVSDSEEPTAEQQVQEAESVADEKDAKLDSDEEAKEEEPKKQKVEKIKSFEELFKLDLEDLEPTESDSDDFDESASKKKGGKNQKSKKSRTIEFDEDLGMTIAKKKHKRQEDEWSDWEDI